MGDEVAPKTVFGKVPMLLFSILTFGSATGIPSSLSVMFLDWQDTFSASRAHTAVVHSTCFSIVLGGAVLAGYVMNRIGARLTVLIGSVLATTGLFISAFATSINYLIVSVGVVSGFGFCFIQLPVMPCATSVVKKYKTVVISLCTLTCALIGIVNRYFIRFLIEQYSWRGACMILAGMTLHTSVGGLIITAFIKPSKKSLLAADDEDSQDCTVVTEQQGRHDCPESGDACQTPISWNSSRLHENEMKDDVYQISNSSINVHPADNNKAPTNSIQRVDSKSIVIESDGFFQNDDTDSTNGHKLSQWGFFLDIMFILLSFHIAICVASLYSFCLILMDFARTLKFDESTGVLFLTITFSTSLVGRALVSVGDIFPRIHSFFIQAAMALPGCLAILLLSFITERTLVLCLLTMTGVSVGGLVAIYPKCALDVRSVNRQSYPIALGFFYTMEGVMCLVVAVAIGFSVDMTGSYTFILLFMGSASLLSTFLLGCGHVYTTRREKHLQQQQR